jgi:hypothetical protein
VRRIDIEARVDELAAVHRGEDFVAAMRELSDGLEQQDRDVLGAVLLERAGALENAAEERARAKGWIRRTFDINARLHRDQRKGRDR